MGWVLRHRKGGGHRPGPPAPPPPVGCTVTINGDQASVQAAINAASPGDIICLNAGTWTWTTQITCSKAIILKGAGEGNTIIQDGVASGVAGLAWTVPIGTSVARLTAMTINPSATPGSGVAWLVANGDLTGDAITEIRLDHLTLTGWTANNRNHVCEVNNLYGVADHITYVGGFGQFLQVYHTAYQGVGAFGDNSWAQPTNFGTRKFFFIEYSYFENTNVFSFNSVIEGDGGGGRFVCRDNTVKGLFAFGGHGTETPGRPRGVRAKEVYNNTWTLTTAHDFCIQYRSGTGVVYNNTVVNNGHSLNMLVKLWLVRLTDNVGGWGFADATGLWDLNDATILDSGTATAGTTTDSLVDNTKAWSLNQWAGKILRDTTAAQSSSISANTSNTLTTAPTTAGGAHTYAPGDSYQIRNLPLAIDQPGRGQGDLMAQNPAVIVATGLPGWPHDALEPVRVWSQNPAVDLAIVGSQPNWAVAGVDYIVSTDPSAALPGYTAFTDPHPLDV